MSQTIPPVRHLAVLHPLSGPQLDRLRRAVPEVRVTQAGAEDWADAVAQADAVLLGHLALGVDDLLGAASGLGWIQTASAGVDRHLTARLRDSPVLLTNASGVHAANMGEHLLAVVLAFARGLPALLAAQRRRAWLTEPPTPVFEVEGQTLVVVGLGAIGSAIAQKASGLGMKVVGVRRSEGGPPVPGVARVVGWDGLDGVLALADHVAIAVPLTAATRGLFDAERLARIKAGAHLYNLARGPVVDGPALLDALHSGHLAGAGLDVTDPEPLPSTSPLWDMPQVIVTAHTAGRTPKANERLVDIVIDNLLRAREGRPMRNVVDKQRGY